MEPPPCHNQPAADGEKKLAEELAAAARKPVVDPPAVTEDGLVDITAQVADAMGISHPYLMVDVEPGSRPPAAVGADELRAPDRVLTVRDTLHEVCKERWLREARGDGDAALPLPSVEGLLPDRVREHLLEAQLADPVLRRLVDHKAYELDPQGTRSKRRRAGLSGAAPASAGGAAKVGPQESGQYRRSPLDGVLERREQKLRGVVYRGGNRRAYMAQGCGVEDGGLAAS